ncbi:MAG: DUF2726 domain-containing protein [Rhodobacteraceae bacterium]|nr:DUF2726 domain-containing protein [Paracoccaceae bacterium]
MFSFLSLPSSHIAAWYGAIGAVVIAALAIEGWRWYRRRPRPGWVTPASTLVSDTLTENTPGHFRAHALLDPPGRRLLMTLEAVLPEICPARLRVLPQVAMTGFLRAEAPRDYYSIRGKTIRLVIVDAAFMPVCTLETRTDDERREVRAPLRRRLRQAQEKRRALRLAGIPLLTVDASWNAETLAAHLRNELERRGQLVHAPTAPLPASA